MDAITLTVIFKGAGMVLFIGGIFALYQGFRLYRDGVGADRDNIILQFGKLKAGGRSVGSVVMATAFAWGGLGAWISPNLDKRGEDIKIYSFDTPGGTITTRDLSLNLRQPYRAAKDRDMLVKLLGSAITDTRNDEGGRPIVQLNGKPAEIDLSTAKVANDLAGKVVVQARAQAGLDFATIVFEAHPERRRLVFQPSEAFFTGIKPGIYKAGPEQKPEGKTKNGDEK